MSFYPNGDTVYDGTHTWNNEHDKGAYKRAFMMDKREDQLMQQAITLANPSTPEAFIRTELRAPKPPRRFGYTKNEPTIGSVFAGYQAPDPHSMMDYSGTTSSVGPAGKNSQVVF